MIDLLVAGGGPAGLVTALHAARAGLNVTVIERRTGPIDKACGEGLMPHTVRHLEGLGIELHGRAFRGITYLEGRRKVQAPFRSGYGMGVRRTALHAALTDAAAAAGVKVLDGHVGAVSQDADGVRCGELRARYLAAADGLHSPIRRSLGLSRPSRGPRRWGMRRHVRVAPWSDTVEVYWADGAEAYVTPVAEDCVGIAILTTAQGSFDGHLSRFPALRDRIHGLPHAIARQAHCGNGFRRSLPAGCCWSATPPGTSTRSPARVWASRSAVPNSWWPPCWPTGPATTTGSGGRCRAATGC